jgi:hypothetical protein
MAYRVFFLNRLHEGANRTAYEDWIREVDYPVARAQDAILSYEVTRLAGTLDGKSASPYDALAVLEVTDVDAYRALGQKPEFEQLLAEWSEFVAEAVVVHGEVIE